MDKARILIVDDETINLKLLEEMLANREYSLSFAKNGKKALEVVSAARPDLILLDIMMPKMNGYEVCTKVRERYNLFELPVLMLTAKNQPADVSAGLEAGAND